MAELDLPVSVAYSDDEIEVRCAEL